MRTLVASWALLGVLVLLGQALWRLTPIALEPISTGTLTGGQWALMIAWVLISIYSEGYRGFHLRFSPRTAARALYVADHPTLARVLLAPAFCLGLFGATRKVLIVAWGFPVIILGLVLLVRTLSQPWRGIIDAGVVIGLGLGVLSLLWFFARGLAGHAPPVDPQVPAG
ncbi:MAG: hypothetical protein KC620_07545 [Myxococcales bacterium]|nr:hypothetical protein [Myxococcales bacterium]